MSGTFTAVDLSKLPVPPVLEVIDYEAIFAGMLARLQQFFPEFSALVESDPIYKVLEVVAYERMLDRQRVNDAALATMLSSAKGGDLDQRGANMGVARLVLDPGNPAEGVPPTMESDEDFRRRIQVSPEGFSVAGPEGAYVFHGLSADPRVLDASAISYTPDDIKALVMSVLSANGASGALTTAMTSALNAAKWPGDVDVSVLSREGDGTASAGLLASVDAALTAESVRPMTDHVTVQSATIIPYAIAANLYTFAGPDSAVVLAEARAGLDRYIAESHRLGRDIPRSAIIAALHAEGVQRVELSQPAADIVVSRTEASHCTGITVAHGGLDE